MKLLIVFALVAVSHIALADVITDQNLTPQCTALAQAFADASANKDKVAVRLVDIYTDDLATYNNPHPKTVALMEYYATDSLPISLIVTSKGEVTPINPTGACHIVGAF